jgi:hypothetical protein
MNGLSLCTRVEPRVNDSVRNLYAKSLENKVCAVERTTFQPFFKDNFPGQAIYGEGGENLFVYRGNQ